MSVKPDKIKEEMRNLAPEELREVREMADSLRSEPGKSQMSEEEFARHLAAKGVISLPEASSGEEVEDEFGDYELIMVEGRPLSEMVVEGRRREEIQRG